jgi:deazaflavin-dependent oxidoreductase (nitroreductase family)
VCAVAEDVFPDVRWGHEPGPLLHKTVRAFGSSRLGSWCIRKLRPLDHRLLSRSNGRYTIAGPMGTPLLLLTTTGKKSGQRRQTPLLYQREGDRLFLVASNFGQSMHPAWSLNLLADPNAPAGVLRSARDLGAHQRCTAPMQHDTAAARSRIGLRRIHGRLTGPHLPRHGASPDSRCSLPPGSDEHDPGRFPMLKACPGTFGRPGVTRFPCALTGCAAVFPE